MLDRAKLTVKKPESTKQNSVHRTPEVQPPESINSPVDYILHLQRTIGNRAVNRLLKSGALQVKLKIGQPGDIYEQEADRIADQVMRIPIPGCPECKDEEEETIQTKPLSDQITPVVRRQPEEEEEEEEREEEEEPIRPKLISSEHPVLQRQVEEEEEEEEPIQPQGITSRTPEATPDLESGIQAIRGRGEPLPASTRAFFEPRFGYDFSQVRTHTDAWAAELAQSMNARAFTVGRNIVFGMGEYAPMRANGRRLLGHELAHVMQQKASNSYDHIQRACGRKAIGSTPPDCVLVSKMPSGDRFLFKVNCDEFAAGEEARLATFAHFLSPTAKVDILGLASFDGLPSFNESLSCHRADRAKAVLLREGVSPANIRFVEATGGIRPPHDPTLRAVDISVEQVSPPSKKPPEKPEEVQYICGPDISAPLSAVFREIQTTFASWSDSEKNMCCAGLFLPVPFVVNPIMAWDIRELYLPNTYWLYDRPYCARFFHLATCHCGVPATGTPGTSSIENAKTSPCGNAVQVNNRCFLAGTANYGTFGIMYKLCYRQSLRMKSKHGIFSPLNPAWYTEGKMKTLIWLWKKGTGDDPGPPTDWAVATYKGGPSGVPSSENRGYCTGRCSVPYRGKPFDFVWEPHKPR